MVYKDKEYKLWWASANLRTNLAKLKTNSDKMRDFINELGSNLSRKIEEIKVYLRDYNAGTTVYSNVDIQQWIYYIKNTYKQQLHRSLIFVSI